MSGCCCCFPKLGRSRQGRGLRLNRRKRNGLAVISSTVPTNSTIITSELAEGVSGGAQSGEADDIPSLIPSVLAADSQNDRSPSDVSAEYQLRYCGMLKAMQGLNHSEEDHLDLINTLDHSKDDGQFISADSQDDYVVFHLSKHGMKVMEASMPPPKYVRWRYSLLEIVLAVHYEDQSKRTYLAVKLGQLGEQVYDCLLFQCSHPGQASQICKLLSILFDTVCHITSI